MPSDQQPSQKFVPTSVWFNNESDPHLVEAVPEEEESDITENVLLSSGESVLMQTAKTEVKNPRNKANQNIRMLLDTGVRERISQKTWLRH